MTDTLGHNASGDLKRRIARRMDVLDRMVELQEELKGYKAEDKADGYTERAMANVIKLLRADAETVLKVLMLEAETFAYRQAGGVVTDLETAQANAAAAASVLPSGGRRPSRDDDDDDDA